MCIFLYFWPSLSVQRRFKHEQISVPSGIHGFKIPSSEKGRDEIFLRKCKRNEERGGSDLGEWSGLLSSWGWGAFTYDVCAEGVPVDLRSTLWTVWRRWARWSWVPTCRSSPCPSSRRSTPTPGLFACLQRNLDFDWFWCLQVVSVCSSFRMFKIDCFIYKISWEG